MRNSTVLALGMAFAMAMPLVAQPNSPMKLMNDAKKKVFGMTSGVNVESPKAGAKQIGNDNRKQVGLMKMSELAKKMKPGTTKAYGWSKNKWELDDTYMYTYDTSGNVIVEVAKDKEGYYSKTVSEYNTNNKVTFKENMISRDGVKYENNKKSEFEYDPILTNIITQRLEWMWLQTGLQYEWKPVGNTYKRIITRDEAGNITSVVIAVLYNGDFDPTQRLDITYGEDGKASTISEQILGYDGKEFYWEQGVKISNIVWDRTDGQIYDPEDLFIGNNRIGSARYEDPDDLDMNVTVEYPDDSDAYIASMIMTMDGETITATSEYIPLENEGYISIGTTYFEGAELYSTREEYRMDDWGLMTLSYEEESEGGMTYGEGSVGEVEYDEEGKPLTYTIGEFFTEGNTDEKVINYVIRAEYSDYVDVTAAVDGLDVDGAGPVRYYNLQGMPVAHPEKGMILIQKQGEKALKIEY